MEKPTDLETRYQKLAAEYSKVRSQATVLKKAVLDEQAKSLELKDVIKKHEQKIRKHDQEMESLTFRNEQLTKRIAVLQQELEINSHPKKSKNKTVESVVRTDMSVIDEELQKKILENAQLVSNMADKDYELNDCKERNEWLERKYQDLQKQLQDKEASFLEEIKKLKRETNGVEKQMVQVQSTDLIDASSSSNKVTEHAEQQVKYWKGEADKWRSKYEIIHGKPESNEQLAEYYENKLKDLFQKTQVSVSETQSLWAENSALYARMENLTLEKKQIESKLDRSNEELTTTNENYKSQLDAMTEHLAAQNDKITKQCDEIQMLKHKISMKK